MHNGYTPHPNPLKRRFRISPWSHVTAALPPHSSGAKLCTYSPNSVAVASCKRSRWMPRGGGAKREEGRRGGGEEGGGRGGRELVMIGMRDEG